MIFEKKLSDKTLKKFKPKSVYYRVELKNYPGLSLRVEPSGNIIFRFRFQLGKQRKEVSIGSYPARTMQELLLEHAKFVNQIKNGVDPVEAKRKESYNPTIKEFSIEYLSNCESRGLRGPTLKEYRRIFDKYILKKHPGTPSLADAPVSELKRREISVLVNYIAFKMPNTYKGKATKGAPTQANRVLAVLSGLCRFAIENELLEYNPASAVKKPGKVRTKDRYLTMDEIKTVHDIINGSGTRLIYDAFMLALLTGQRLNQIATLRKSYIKNNWLEFPAEVMKSGKLHKVYLCKQAAQIIDQRKLDALTNDFILLGEGTGHVHPDSLKRALARLMPLIEAEGVPKFSFHDLRRTLSTHFNRLGFRGIDKAVLGHSASGVTEIFYNRYNFEDEVKRALTVWGEAINRAIDGTKADVLEFKSGKS